MAHTLLFSGYGAPGCDDLAVCRLTADGTLETLSTLRHGRAPSFCCRGQNGWIYAASERGDGADVTAYVLDGTTLREIARIEIPTGRGLCHLYACGDVIYGSCFENGLYFAVDSALTRILWQFQPAGANAHWVQSVGHALFLADLGNSRLYRLALENNLPTGSVKTLPQPTGSGPRQVLDAGDGMLDCVYELDGHMRVLNHDGCTVSTVQASTVPKPRSWPGGACATADGTLFVSNRGPNTISAWQRSGPTRHFLCEWPTGDWPRALCAVPGTLYLLAACQREGAVLGKAAKAAGHGADFIPYLEFGAAGTQLDHGTGELMSQLVGVAHKVQVAVPEIQFPVAQAAAGNLHHYFARPRFFLYFVDLKAMRLHQKCAFELHCFPHFLFCCVISFFNL